MRPVLAILALLGAVACSGSDDDDEPSADAAASSADAAGATADASASCDRDGLTPDASMAERDDELEVLFYTATGGDRRLTIDFYFSLGATDDAHTHTLTGEGLDTCHTCVFAHAGCGELLCDKAFVAVSGAVEVTAMGGAGEAFTGSLTDAVFAEATIDAGTQETTLVEGGETWCFDDHAFDVVVLAP